MIIPLKEPAWKAKVKEEREPQRIIQSTMQVKKEGAHMLTILLIETVPNDNLDEARRALLKDLYKDEKEGTLKY